MGRVTMPILYSFRRCPYAMRARLAVRISGLQVDRVEVKLRDKPPAMLAASPKGTVPVLVLPNGRVIDESLDIMRHALAFADPENWLAREDAAIVAANDGAFKYHLDRYKYPERHDGDPLAHRAAGLDWLRALDERLAGQANLNGEGRGLTDMAVMPFVRQFAAVDRNWFDAQDIPHLQRWLATHLESPLFVAVMERIPETQVA